MKMENWTKFFLLSAKQENFLKIDIFVCKAGKYLKSKILIKYRWLRKKGLIYL